MRMSSMIGMGLGLAWIFAARDVVAQDEAAARALFDRGIAARDRGDFAAGCPDLGESHRLAPKLGTLFQWAKCEEAAGKIASADVHFHQFVTGVRALPLPDQAKYDDRVAEAEEARKTFGGDIPSLTLVLPAAAPTNIAVVRDGTTLTSVLLGVAIPVDPGEHLVTTQVPGGPVHEQRFTVERREAKRIELQFVLPPAVPVVTTNPSTVLPRREQDGPSGVRTAGLVVMGVGAAGLLTWGVGGLVAMNDRATVAEVCPGDQCRTPADKTTGRDAWNRGTTSANIASVGLGVGVVGAVVGLVMVIAGSPHEKPVPRKSALTVDAGPTGVSFGVQGVFP